VKIACAYPDGNLPAEWFQFVRRLRSQLARVSVDARIRLVPVSAVPADAELVLLPASVTEPEGVKQAGRRVIPVTPRDSQTVLNELIEVLRREAPALLGPGVARPTVVRRGFGVVDWSADIGTSADGRRR
jgi:hypothetical protein